MAYNQLFPALASNPDGAAPYVEQGVIANGTQDLDFGGPIAADNPTNLAFLSFANYTDARAHLIDFTDPAGSSFITADFTTSDALLDPRISVPFDTGVFTGSVPTKIATGSRVHMWISTQPSGSDIAYQFLWWDATNGFQLSSGIRPGGTTVNWTTDGGNYHLLSRSDGGQKFTGTIWRIVQWVGQWADLSSATVRNNFVNGAVTVNPAISRSAYGVPVIDCYGNKDVWDSGVFPVGNFPTVTGDAFANAA